MENKTVILSKFQIDSWKQIYGIKDAQYGGLVLGNRHIEGSIESGVKIVNPIDSDRYRWKEENILCALGLLRNTENG